MSALRQERTTHTVKVIAAGLLLLALYLLAGRWFGGHGSAVMAAAAKYFIPLWLCLAGLNMWLGVSRAGYSVADEAPIFVVVFAVPAAVAALLWWWLTRG